jgi:hypothetical protein
MSRSCYEVTALPGVEDGILPAPAFRRVGRGTQAVWPYSRELLDNLWDRVVDLYVSTDGWGDEDASRDRAAMKVWLDRYRHLVPRERW